MRRLFVLITAMSLLAAACGDDTSDTPTTVAAVTTTTQAPTTQAPTTTTTQAAPEGISFTGADGTEVTITDSTRIISLNGDITEILFAIGAGDRVIAVDVTTTYPPEALAIGPPIGFGQRLAAEPIIGLNPTLVIGDEQIGPPEVIDQIRAAGIPVAIITLESQLSGIRTKIETVAALVGEETAGATLAEAVDAEIDEAIALAATASSTPKVAFVYARGPEALLLFGPGSVTSALFAGANATDSVQGPPVGPLTPEALAAANPDFFVTSEAAVGSLGGPQAFADLPGVAQTTAGQEGALLVYDDALFLGFGPRTGEALRTLVLDLHPELAGN
ncbi:MAG: ABC transporter substrate-binding protein [Acidimicrobiia bacterium]|nr:ABC transporter substrate-binding protein [Acidimicrobiia bacterium]